MKEFCNFHLFKKFLRLKLLLFIIFLFLIIHIFFNFLLLLGIIDFHLLLKFVYHQSIFTLFQKLILSPISAIRCYYEEFRLLLKNLSRLNLSSYLNHLNGSCYFFFAEFVIFIKVIIFLIEKVKDCFVLIRIY